MTMRIAALLALALTSIACSNGEPVPGDIADEDVLTIYSGRSEDLIGGLIQTFENDSGIEVDVRYGDTAELAAQIIEEGENSPADVFVAQDAGSLGALEEAGRFVALSAGLLERVAEPFRSPDGAWVGTSGRVRVIAFNPNLVDQRDVPDTVAGLTDPRWEGVVGWAPTNSSFIAFVTAFRVLHGEDTARDWLVDMKENGAEEYPDNDAIAEAIAQGEITLGLVNHYYPYEVREEIPDAEVEAHFLTEGDPGGLINVAGAGILDTADDADLGEEFVRFLLSDEGQEYFVEETWEYPLVEGIPPFEGLPPLDSLDAPQIDLRALADLEGTLALLQDAGLT